MGYFGSKAGSGAYQAIVAHMPPHDTYIETHLGSGVILNAKPPAARQIGLELDPSVSWPPGPPGAEFMRADCVAFLESFDFAAAGRCVVYADPPYVLATRSSAKRYRFDYTDADHERLAAVLRAVPAAVILSGYPSPLYDRLYGDWRTFEFQAMTRGGPRTEKLWLNFPAGQVQWARFAGRDFTDRQRIKRKAARWAKAYGALQAGERLAVLAAMMRA